MSADGGPMLLCGHRLGVHGDAAGSHERHERDQRRVTCPGSGQYRGPGHVKECLICGKQIVLTLDGVMRKHEARS